MPAVVGEGDPDCEGPALIGWGQFVGRARLSRYFDVDVVAGSGVCVDDRLVVEPLVLEGCVGQPVGVINRRGVRRQRLADLGRPRDSGKARRSVFGRGRHGHRRRAGQCLLVVGVVGEGHPDLESGALVIWDKRVGLGPSLPVFQC